MLIEPALARAEDEGSAVRTGLERLGLSGSVAFDYFSSNHGIDDRRHFPGVNLDLKQRLTIAEGIRWVGELRVLAQQVGHEDEDAVHGSVRDLRYADEVTSELREGYFEVSRGQWEIRGGRQLIVWGRADELNPTDVITPKNFLLLLPEGQAGYRFGVNALKADYFLSLSGVRVTGVWVPVSSASIIPISTLPEGVRLTDRLPPVRFEDGSAGVKLDRSGGKIDASLSYFYGFNLLPEVHIERASLDEVTRTLHADVALEHERQHMIGGDFATTRGRFGYRGEVAYVLTDNPHGRRVESIVPYLYYVLGVERSFFTNFSVILQYVGRWVPDRIDPERALGDPNPVRGRALFLAARETFAINQQLDTVQNGWTLRLDKKFWNDTLDLELLGVHYLPRNDFFLRPRITYDLADAWKLTIGGEILHGPKHSYLGRVQRNTGAFAEVKYSF
jgi:hypothetical protein